jgi:hypothetical protein
MIQKYKGYEVAYVEYDVKRDIYALIDSEERLVAELKRHEYLSQPQLRTIGNSHGKYRKPSSPLRGGPARQPGNTVSGGTIVLAGAFVTFTINPNGTLTIDTDYPGPVEDAGIRAGEVTAQRCWWVRDRRLFSVYMSSVEWHPNTPVSGDVSVGYGVHGFKTHDDLARYRSDAIAWKAQSHYRCCDCPMCRGMYPDLVSGTVSMWGQIVEHERGYRAEHAKIVSLDTDDQWLRMKYGV